MMQRATDFVSTAVLSSGVNSIDIRENSISFYFHDIRNFFIFLTFFVTFFVPILGVPVVSSVSI